MRRHPRSQRSLIESIHELEQGCSFPICQVFDACEVLSRRPRRPEPADRRPPPFSGGVKCATSQMSPRSGRRTAPGKTFVQPTQLPLSLWLHEERRTQNAIANACDQRAAGGLLAQLAHLSPLRIGDKFCPLLIPVRTGVESYDIDELIIAVLADVGQ